MKHKLMKHAGVILPLLVIIELIMLNFIKLNVVEQFGWWAALGITVTGWLCYMNHKISTSKK